jgi:dTDP-6-deoxy-L-talose 4-dehydrogenase (NAD+)|tara:strand:- start:29 stop:859 length:831 start_codon:yes stop_codon:yes gene_type:complete
MAKILLTGATGFVGRQILKQLENSDHKITIVVRPNWSRRISFNKSKTNTIITNDLFSQNYEWWEDNLAGIDTVIHTAWYTEPGLYLTSSKNTECLNGTIALAKAAKAKNISRFVGLGTCIEYHISDEYLTIDTPLAPNIPYSIAKVDTFNFLTDLFGDSKTSFLWCRLFYLFGEGEDNRRFYSFIHQSLKDGKVANLTSGNQIRDFLDVKIAAELIIKGTFGSIEGPANICSGRGKSIQEFAREIADIYGRRDLLNFGSRPDNLIDPRSIIGIPSL